MKTYESFVRSDVYESGPHPEDGERREHLVFFVVCEDERGARFASLKCWKTEGMGRDECEARAEAFRARVNEWLAAGADPATSEKWAPTFACYGSDAYSEADALEAEARDLEVEAGPFEADRFRAQAGIGGAP